MNLVFLLCEYAAIFIHSTIDNHLVCFQFFATMNNTRINILVHVFRGTLDTLLSSIYLTGEFLSNNIYVCPDTQTYEWETTTFSPPTLEEIVYMWVCFWTFHSVIWFLCQIPHCHNNYSFIINLNVWWGKSSKFFLHLDFLCHLVN